MTALLDSSTHHDAADTRSAGSPRGIQTSRQRPQLLRIGFVNNMPDTALMATERQFTRLVQGVATSPIDLQLFHIPDVPRGAEAMEILAARYKPVDQLFASDIDALIVTGNEPRAQRLDEEPYWKDLTALVDWAKEHTRTSIWSCLAAHAAVLHLDDIERQRLPQKKSGVLISKVNGSLPYHLPPSLSVCHSRLNEVRKDELLHHGYQVISEAAGGHVDIFSKQLGSRFVFLQGHPEYDADSLMREYRRDVGRYLNRQRDSYPDVPENYFDDDTVLRMENYRTRTERERDARLCEDFPAVTLRRGLEGTLAQSASAIFANWLASAGADVKIA